MANYEWKTVNGVRYHRPKGTRQQWKDAQGNVVDLSTGTARVVQQAPKTNDMAGISEQANPTVWIKDGKAYKDPVPGADRSNYYNAVKKLGQNLGWDVKAGSQSAKNLQAQNQKFNQARIKTVQGKIAVITPDGKAARLVRRTPSTTNTTSANSNKNRNWLDRVGDKWKAFWDKPMPIPTMNAGINGGYNMYAAADYERNPQHYQMRRGDFGKMAATAAAIPAAVTAGAVPTAIALAKGTAGSYMGSLIGQGTASLLGAEDSGREFLGDVGGTLGGLWAASAGSSTTRPGLPKPTSPELPSPIPQRALPNGVEIAKGVRITPPKVSSVNRGGQYVNYTEVPPASQYRYQF